MTEGKKTSEFKFGTIATILVAVLTTLQGTGVFGENAIVATVIACVLAVLAALGYTASRTVVKAKTNPLHDKLDP